MLRHGSMKLQKGMQKTDSFLLLRIRECDVAKKLHSNVSFCNALNDESSCKVFSFISLNDVITECTSDSED